MAHGGWLINLNLTTALQRVVARGGRPGRFRASLMQCFQSITASPVKGAKHEAQASQTDRI